MDKYRFIVLETRVVSGVVYVYGWLDHDGFPSPDPIWYELTRFDELKTPAA